MAPLVSARRSPAPRRMAVHRHPFECDSQSRPILATPEKFLLGASPMAMALVRSGAHAVEASNALGLATSPAPEAGVCRPDHSGGARRLPSGHGVQPLPSGNNLDRDAIDRQRVPLIASDDDSPAFSG